MNKKFTGLESDAVVKRALLKGCGFSDEDIQNKPHIGIVNTFNEGAPGHAHLRQYAEAVKQGVWAAGGVPIEFGVPSTCGDMNLGNKELIATYEVAARDVVALAIELVATVHEFDGLVLLASCDSIIPGVCMGAIRMNVPSIIVTGGPMLPGEYEGKEILPCDLEPLMMRPDLDSRMKMDIENTACMCPGACASMGTANSMQIMMEVLGWTFPHTATIPGVYAEKLRTARRAGKRVVEMVAEDLKPSDFLTREAFLNAVTTDIAMGGSTNLVLHLIYLAREAGVELTIDDFGRIGKSVPCICGVKPSGPYSIVDLHKAGGVPAMLKELKSLLNLDTKTITGETLGQVIENAQNKNPDLIRSLDNPISTQGGLTVLRGNLAPGSAIIRGSSVAENMKKFSGPARVFNGEPEGYKAIMGGLIKPGDVIVIRYEGPKGTPGMRQLMCSADALVSRGLETSVGLITDGSFSGFNKGPLVGHITPEAYVGGPLALVEEGDMITVDIKEAALTLHVSDSELAARRAKWTPPQEKPKKGIMNIFTQLCRSAEEGAGMTR